MSRGRMNKIGWAAILVVCVTLYVALHIRVNAVKSEVRRAEDRIVVLQREKIMLETEFQARANQQQLAMWNDVEFGYKAPTADQFLSGERQLARFGTPRAKGAPEPIRVASAADTDTGENGFPSMVSPLTGQALAAEAPQERAPAPVAPNVARENLSARLMRGAARVALDEIAEAGE